MYRRSQAFAVLAALLLLGLPAGLGAQAATPCATAPSIEGTIWEGEETLQTGYVERVTYEFLKGGALAYTTANGRFNDGDKWTQNGACITMDINDGYSVFTGQVSGEKLVGDFVRRSNFNSTVKVTRRWTGGDSRAGRDWENLRGQYKREYGAGLPADAARTAERAASAAAKAFSADDERVFMTLKDLALIMLDAGRHANALPHAQRAATIAESKFGADSRERAEALNAIGRALEGMKKYVEAEDVVRPALEAAEKAFGPRDPIVALLLNNLGNLLSDQDRYEEAEPFLERSLQLLDTGKPEEEQSLAAVLNNLAVVKKELGKLDEARMQYERSLGILERRLGEEHRTLIPILNNLVKLYETMEWKEEAAEAKARVQRIQSRRG